MADPFGNMSQDEFFKKMAEAIKGSGPSSVSAGGVKGATGDPEKFKKELDKYVKSIKDTLEPQKVWKSTLEGQKQPLVDVTEALKDLDEALEKAVDESEVDRIKEAKAAIARQAVNQNLRASAVNLSTGLTKAAGTIASGVVDFTKGLLSNRSGIELSTDLAAKTARGTGEAVSSVGSVISGLGASLMPLISKFGMWGKIFTGLAFVLGPIVEKLGLFAAQLAEEGIRTFGAELTKTQENFRKITGAGAMFAGGMTEMRQQAGKAGLTVEDFGNAIKNNTESLSQMGLGMSQAAKRMAGITGEIRKSGLGDQLTNLGYSMEEFASLSAQTAANLNASGKLRSMNDLDVAKATLQYGKDLKVIQQLTGEDAKKRMEAARKKALEADVFAAVMAKGGQEAVLKLQSQLSILPEDMQKGYLELVSTGGTAIADAATNVAITQNPLLMTAYQGMLSDLGNTRKDQTAALDGAKDYIKAAGDYAKQNYQTTQAIGTSARITGDALLQGATSIASSLINVGINWSEESSKKGRETIDKLATTNDKLTNEVKDLEKTTYNLKVATEQAMTGMLGAYTQHLTTMVETVGKVVERLNKQMAAIQSEDAAKAKEEAKGENEKGGEMAGAVALGGVAAIVVGGFVAALTAGAWIPIVLAGLAGGALFGFLGKELGGMFGGLFDSKKPAPAPAAPAAAPAAKPADTKPMDKKAMGGIVNKASIFGEAGPEAAVPLPDGRTIPVTLKIKDNAPKSVTGIMADMKTKTGFGSEFGRPINQPSRGLDSSPNLDSTKLSKEVSEAYTKLVTEMKPDNTPLVDGLSGMSKILENQTAVTASTDQTMKELVGLIKAQLSKHDEMINELKNNVTINQRMLNHAYS
jgi:hypothetical protein